MRSVLHNLLVVAIALALSVAASRLLRPPPTDRYIEVELEDMGKAPDANLKDSILDAATIERFRQWRFKPKKVRPLVIPIPPIIVPPPPNHESSRWIKAVS
jgi:hypothetical protein